MFIGYRPKSKPKTLNERFIHCMWDIIEFHRENKGALTSVYKFAPTIKQHGASFTRFVGKHNYRLPTKNLAIAFEKYRINPTYIFLGEGKPFLDDSYKKHALEQRISKEQQEIQMKMKEIAELKKKISR